MSAPNDAERPDTAMQRRTVSEVLVFFALTFALTAPFWAISAASGKQLLPGLPLAALAVICPATSALFLSWRLGGFADARALMMRVMDFGRVSPWAWWLLILLISPAVSAASFLILRHNASSIPDPQISIISSAALLAVLLAGGVSEELGWTGFALEPLQARLGALPAALLIGAVWSVWHYPALSQAHRSVSWIAWWTLGTVSMRVFMVWLYNTTGRSVFGVATLHAISNLCWQLFPVHGSWFDPRVNGEVMFGVALTAVLISIRQGGLPRARAPHWPD